MSRTKEFEIPAEKQQKDAVMYCVEGKESIRIIAKNRSSATIFLELVGSDVHIDVTVGEEASLHVVCLQSGANASISQRAKVAAGGTIHWHNITLGDGVTQDLRSELTGANATSDIDWVFSAKDNERQTISARNIFSARGGGGEITLKGVAQDRAQVTCNGMIEIAEQGTGTDTYLTEDVLMLDKTAHVDAIPGLEIRTNDVKASHSATISQVTAEDLFYFQSRGIDQPTARTMYIEGFLSDLLSRIAHEDVRREVLTGIGIR